MPIDLPERALSIRQPWTWAVVHGGKDIENRNWNRTSAGINYRGRFAVHASTGMTQHEYRDARRFMESIGVSCPEPADLRRGGIIGVARLVDVVKESDSPWFFGRIGLLLEDAKPVPFIPCAGALGFFKWKRCGAGYEPAPAKWMLQTRQPPTPTQRELLQQ